MTMLLMLKMLMLACLCLHPTLAVSSDAMVNSTEIVSELRPSNRLANIQT